MYAPSSRDTQTRIAADCGYQVQGTPNESFLFRSTCAHTALQTPAHWQRRRGKGNIWRGGRKQNPGQRRRGGGGSLGKREENTGAGCTHCSSAGTMYSSTKSMPTQPVNPLLIRKHATASRRPPHLFARRERRCDYPGSFSVQRSSRTPTLATHPPWTSNLSGTSDLSHSTGSCSLLQRSPHPPASPEH